MEKRTGPEVSERPFCRMKLLEVKKEDWLEDEKNIEAFLDRFGPRITLGLRAHDEGLPRRLDVPG